MWAAKEFYLQENGVVRKIVLASKRNIAVSITLLNSLNSVRDSPKI